MNDLLSAIYFRRIGCLIVSCTLILNACKNKAPYATDDWNSGKMTIATDENLKNIMQQLVAIYEHENLSAKITLDYLPQDKIISDFISGKIKSMIISRNLTQKEINLSSLNQKSESKEYVFAYNAVALITDKSFKDSVFDISSFKNYLNADSPVKLVFDNTQSGITRFIFEKSTLESTLFKNALVVKSADEVVEYVQRNKASIGFIPFNLISDTHNAKMNTIRSKIKILSVKQKDTISSVSQENIYTFSYPLQQPLNMVLGNNPELVGKGFVTFLCKEKAAKIILKAGLVPNFMPSRNIIVSDELKTN